MKDQILKIAKVKSEKEFYKKYPTEEAFMAKHGKAFKKAAMGAAMVEDQLDQLTDFGNPPEAAVGKMLNAPAINPEYRPVSLSGMMDSANATNAGLTKDQYLRNQSAQQRQASNIGNRGGSDILGQIGGAMKQFGGEEVSKLGDTIGKAAGMFDDGGEIPQAGVGDILGGAKDWITGKGKYTASQIGVGGTPANITGGGNSIWNQSSNPSILGGNTLPNIGIPGNTAANSIPISGGGAGAGINSISGKLTGQGGLPGALGKGAGMINKGLDKLGGAGNVLSSASDIVKGFGQVKEQKNAIARAQTAADVSGLVKQANSGPKQIEKHDFLQPADQSFSQDQTSPTYGTGWNPLTAEDGAELKGYSNTYNNPYTLYSGLGYEPLNDSSIKQYADGGYVSNDWTPQVITHFGDMTANDFYKASKEMRTGGSIRENDMFGSDYYPIADNGYGKWMKRSSGPGVEVQPSTPIDHSPQDTYIKSNTQLNSNTTDGNFTQGATDATYSRNMTAGQPADEMYRYATTNGDKFSEFTRIAPEGGTPVNELHRTEERRPFLNLIGKKQLMDRYDKVDENKAQQYLQEMHKAMPGGVPGMATGGAMNGRLATHWGGKAEDVSHNPYGAGTGITSMLHGNSHSESDGHGNTGIGIGYAEDGANMQGVDAEAQRNEPVVEVTGPNGQPTAHVAGKIKIPKYVAKHIGDASAEGQTFQNYLGKTIVKRENKANKNISEGLELINNSNPANPIENAAFMSGKMKFEAGNQVLKELARIKEDSMHWQAAFNEAAPEFGYEDSSKFVEDTNKGKIDLKKAMMAVNQKTAAYGMDMGDPTKEPSLPQVEKAKYDEIKTLYDKAEKTKNGTDVRNFQKRYHELFPEYARAVIGKEPLTSYAKAHKYKIGDLRGNEDGIFGKRTKQYMAALQQPTTTETTTMPPRTVTVQTTTPPPGETPPPTEIPKGGGIPWQYGADQLLDYFAKPLRKDLDINQLSGEMYALATNQLDPIRAQKVNPLLLNPYQISLQDQMNANQADFNAITRLAGNNPAALASLAGQKYRANSGVLGEQFRTNQGLASNVYNENRRILNDNALKNMDIMNNQWMLQEKAKANTKATNIAALSSIADKYAKNASENFAAAITQNLYPKFRYDANGKAYVVPSFTSPINMPTLGASSASTAGQNKIPGFQDFLNKTANAYSQEYNKNKTGANGLIVKNFKKI
jgi:hypothetical protein